MNRPHLSLIILTAILPASASERMVLDIDGEPLVTYQALPMTSPRGNATNPPADFKGSNFIHPLKTPSGFTITCSQPDDHLHHFGLWWPWKHVQDGTRTINCWELQAGEGIVQGRKSRVENNLLHAEVDYIDRKNEAGPTLLLKEWTTLQTEVHETTSASGYYLDIGIQQATAGDRPMVIPVYRYSGFSIRATAFWNKDNSSILTSAGKDRSKANFSHARWVLVQGKTDMDGMAGFLILSHPGNKSHPEMLRTWDEQNDGAVFVNFNTVGEEPWTYLPGNTYTRRYRVFVFDGKLDASGAEAIWQAYAAAN